MTTLTIIMRQGTSLEDLVGAFRQSVNPRLWQYKSTTQCRITVKGHDVAISDVSPYFQVNFFEPEISTLRSRFGDHPAVFEVGMARTLEHFQLVLQAVVRPDEMHVYTGFGICCSLVEFLRCYQDPEWDWSKGQGGFGPRSP